jgi:hypothetical protein
MKRRFSPDRVYEEGEKMGLLDVFKKFLDPNTGHELIVED